MTLSEIIIEKMQHYGLLINDDITSADIDEMIECAKRYDNLIPARFFADNKNNWKDAMAQIFILSALEYGQTKWNEAIQATTKAIAQDNSLPPVFIP